MILVANLLISTALVSQAPAPVAVAATHATASTYAATDQRMSVRSIDYQALDGILRAIVFEAGRSDRRGAHGRLIRTGTRISAGNSSPYRYEGNRLMLHAFQPEHLEEITSYREELQQLPDLIDFEALPDNERLAYWLNLHNVAMIELLARNYPIRDVRQVRGARGAAIYDLPAATVRGETLSFNDIRFGKVASQWNDPLVIYGFLTGAVGGPSILGRAFTGERVWQQLEANAGEFVNSLRGVEDSGRGFMVSPIYDEWRDAVFPAWPVDLRRHLNQFAEADAADTISIGGEPRFLSFDWSIADVTHGQPGCRVSDFSPVSVTSIRSNSPTGDSNTNPCTQLPIQAQRLVEVVTERRLEFLRQGRIGSVTIRDIATDPDGNGDGPSILRVDEDGNLVED